ncbi:3'-5' exonuclease [Microvirga sp. Mcv34]|uniref:3'-5' exonuclease n=1 Tax=Microvirga sp. Mcv34 TaxID=2926016 RepID=UPI0021C999C0|nr:3'-5' exonuclease [Microvirga sp. Mcv34]
MADALEATGRYRVLRQLPTDPQAFRPMPDPQSLPAGHRIGLYVDVETTSLDPRTGDIIELAMVPFTFTDDGQIIEIFQPFQQLQQPSQPIPPAITALTGIDDAMVEGKAIDIDAVVGFVAAAEICAAHKAAFDRRWLEKLTPVFATKPWVCSLHEIPWKEEGFESLTLSYIGMKSGFFFDAHRAAEDCLAALQILKLPLPKSGRSPISYLLEASRAITCRIKAPNTPYERKELLKARSYRWSDGSDGSPKAWWIDVPQEKLNDEITFLQSHIYMRPIDLPIRRITALERFSARAD